MENNTFKGTLFGGFNREDVISYITKTSAASNERIAALEADIDKFCRQEQEMRAQLDGVLGEKEALERELAALRAAAAERDVLAAEVEALRAEVDTLRPQAEEYAKVKSHIAGIELEARQRNDELDRITRERLAALVGECRSKCDAVLSTLTGTCANISGEMQRLDAAVSSLPGNFDELRGNLEHLLD
ncbi:MAG: hypothetical protein IKD11_02080 [Oscillospiraceae bacterium]|nr:hypothetical protein [Oscillospiraceae bacterium]